MKNRKEKILFAMQVILAEYKDKSHFCSVSTCALCREFHGYYDCEDERHECHKCPMFVFRRKNSDEMSCLERKCKPVYCREGQKLNKSIKRVIEFYERAIEGLQKLTNEDLAKKNVFQFLVDIDKEV